MTHSDDAARWLEGRQAEMEEAIAALVSINSYTDNADGGREVGRALSDLYRSPHFDQRVVASERYADHLVLSSSWKPSVDAGAPIALVGHLDTVFPPGVFEGFRRDGDLARGPGVLDMKGGLVVVAWALRALADTGDLSLLPAMRVVIVADEEVGSPEGQGVIREAISDAAACLVFEAGRKGDAIITRRKGTGGFRVTATGVASHAGANHKDGASAIWALAKFIDRVQGLTDYDRGITVNVGKIEGGQGKNTVCDRATALVDIRFCSAADADALVAAFERAKVECAAAVPRTHIELEGGVARPPLERTEASRRVMEAYASCATASGLGGVEAALIGGGSDASTASAIGIASIDGLGPRGVGFHTKDEQIEVASLVRKAQALARFLATFRAVR